MSLVFAVFMVFSFCLPAFAASDARTTNNPEYIYLEDSGYGRLDLTRNKNGNNVIVAQATEDDEIYYINNNKYAIRVLDGVYLQVNRIDVDVDNFSSLRNTIDTSRIHRIH